MKYFNEFTEEERKIYYLGFEKGRQFTFSFLNKLVREKLKKSRKKEEELRGEKVRKRVNNNQNQLSGLIKKKLRNEDNNYKKGKDAIKRLRKRN